MPTLNPALSALARQLGDQLLAKKWFLATAESCTGGGLGYWITHIAGSSAWFDRGFITYSNLSKEQLLGVSKHTLTKFGAVSEEIACEMAKGALLHSQANVSIAITGIAGPEGGSTENPIGSVWIAWANTSRKMQATHYLFSGNRESIRAQSILKAMEGLLTWLKENDEV